MYLGKKKKRKGKEDKTKKGDNGGSQTPDTTHVLE